ncbi:MAG: leucine-rich repeat protein [Alistipes putredinis]
MLRFTVCYLGNNITDIQDRAFYGCTSLRFIILGDYVETIGAYAFYGASSINISTLRVTLPASVKSIETMHFTIAM